MTVNKTLGCTPHELICNTSPYLHLPIKEEIDIQSIKAKILTNIKASENITKQKRRVHNYKEGDFVYKKIFARQS